MSDLVLAVLDGAGVHIAIAVLVPVIDVFLVVVQHQVAKLVHANLSIGVFVRTEEHARTVNLSQHRRPHFDRSSDLPGVQTSIPVDIYRVEYLLNE